MNLQEATEYIKAFLNQEIDVNTLRKACASDRLKAVRKGEGAMHVRRTEWDVTVEDVIQFVREEYHPRPTRRIIKKDKLHIPINHLSTKDQDNKARSAEEPTKSKVFYRVIEHLYQKPLPIHGDELEKYDTRVVEEKIQSKLKAESLVQKLQDQAQKDNLSHQLQYEVESYNSSKKVK